MKDKMRDIKHQIMDLELKIGSSKNTLMSTVTMSPSSPEYAQTS